ncbi:midcut-by-XrtH protein [Paracidovorax avenae]|uniref:midcut-by-XrtH protein n=1 Tax=Paracidovorax avenae TaxID=80867 RepID=UPI000D21E405|nr:midcut-by-XrtH protein [Paracidovorax avenae]AVT11739.1 midcut-by-XrtH protein [Paracidovorax avenae]
MKIASMVRTGAISSLGFALVQSALAQQVNVLPILITYGPPAATPVPTLSQWGIALLSLALGLMIYRSLRKAGNGRPIAGMLLAGALALSMGGAGGWIGKSFAAPSGVQLAQPGGGIVGVDAGLFTVSNTSGVTQQITKITVQNGYTRLSINNGFPAECVVGTILPAGGTCSTHYDAPPPP